MRRRQEPLSALGAWGKRSLTPSYFFLADKGIKVSGTLVYGVKAQGKAKKRKQKREKAVAAGRQMVNGDPVELIRGIKDLALKAGGIRHLKEFVDLLAA